MKTEEIALLAGAGFIAYLVLRKPPDPTPEQQVGGFINNIISSFAPTARNAITRDLASPLNGSTAFAQSPDPMTYQGQLLPDNPLVTDIGAPGYYMGMPIVGTSYNNNSLAVPAIVTGTGVPETALQSPDAWQNGGPVYNGVVPLPAPSLLPPPPPVAYLPPGDPVEQFSGDPRPILTSDYMDHPLGFTYLRSDENGQKYVISAFDGSTVGFLVG